MSDAARSEPDPPDGPPEPAMSAVRAAAMTLRYELARRLPGLAKDELSNLADRLARITVEPVSLAPAGAVLKGTLSGYADGMRDARDYVRSYVKDGAPVAPEDAGRMMAGLNAAERRASLTAGRRT